MRKFIYVVFSVLMIAGFSSCKDQADIYQKWVKNSGYIYPEKSTGLYAYEGYNRVKLTWAYPKDPSVVRAKIYWQNRQDSIEMNYADYVGQDTISILIEGLSEHSYAFEVFNYDAAGNVSMVSEITTSPYAANWLATHAEREIVSAEIQGDGSALINTGFGTDEMVATRFRYVDAKGDTVVVPELLDVNTAQISLPDAVAGSRFEYSSGFCPTEGLDTIWNGWRKSPFPIAGKLDCSSWTAESNTTNDRPTSNLFDGVIGSDINHAWWARTGSFPKILVIDNGKDSYYINKLILYQNEAGGFTYRTNNNVMVYVSDKPFNKDAAFDLTAFTTTDETFTRAKGSWGTVFWNGTAYWSRPLDNMYNARYIAIVFFNSRRNGNALFEVEAYGYDANAE